MLLLQALVEGVKKQSEAAVRKAESDEDVKGAKLTVKRRHWSIPYNLLTAHGCVRGEEGYVGFQAGSTVGGEGRVGIYGALSHWC